MTADEVLEQRILDASNPDMKTQRRFESLFLQFLNHEKTQGYATGTLQSIFASIRSFFEVNYYSLKIRKNDYPKGDANGTRRATKEAILKVLTDCSPKQRAKLTAQIMTTKDSGLRVSDLVKLNCNIILENPNADFIQLTIVTEKTNLLAKTFLGTDAINALKEYLEHRRKGTRTIEPETITNDSPLFRTQINGKVKRISRMGFSANVEQAFIKIHEKKMSSHSLRKYLQTALEKGNMPTNWIDQVLGHKLLNSRDAYSLPTDEELKEAYQKAYEKYVKVTLEDLTKPQVNQPQQTEPEPIQETNFHVIETRTLEEAKQALAKGYKYADTIDGIRLYTKPNRQQLILQQCKTA